MWNARARSPGVSIAWLLAVASLITVLAGVATASSEEPQGAAKRRRPACRGVKVGARARLQRAINRAGRGATLCLAGTTYRTSRGIRPRSGQRLVGVSRSRTVIRGASAPVVIYARGTSNVTLKKLSVAGAVGRPACRPQCGKGIVPGNHTRILRVRVHHNRALGIGGAGPGLLIRKAEIDHNGHADFYGCCAGAVKAAQAYTIRKTHVHDNVGVGIWCDVGCHGGRWKVVENTVVGNTLGGIRYEISGMTGSAVIKRNVVRSNNLRNAGGHGGIEINSSRNVVIERNRVIANRGPGVIANGRRRPGLGNISVRFNDLSNDEIHRCGGPVRCRGNG